MKFIHTADVHWGMEPDSDKPWSRERAQAIKDTFTQVITRARDLEVDFLFISGDLFHRQPLQRDLKEINYLFSTIPAVHVVMIAGNHDRIRSNSAVLSFSWCPNVTFLMNEEMDHIYFSDCNTDVHGFSYHTAEIRENRIDHVEVPFDGRIHVLLAHGGDATHLPFDKNALAVSGFSYIALGHIHKPGILVENKAAFAGSPEPLDKTETGIHGAYYGEINPVSQKVEVLKYLPLCRSQYIPLAVNITASTTNVELEDKISQEIEKRGRQNIYRFRIRGMRDPETEFDLENLTSKFRIVEILDESEPQYDFSALFAEHPSDMIGFYIRALQKPDMSPVEKKALYYGIHALLQTTDERS
ncbi:metallophosphoesterase family protein [Lachnospiraceae bacterium HCP1S3_A8]